MPSKPPISVIAITILMTTALLKGIDHLLLSPSLALISRLRAYLIHRAKDR